MDFFIIMELLQGLESPYWLLWSHVTGKKSDKFMKKGTFYIYCYPEPIWLKTCLFNPFPCLHPLLSLFQFNFSAWIAAPAPLLTGQTAAKAASKTGTFFCQDFFLCLFHCFFLTQGFTPCYSPPPTQSPPCRPMSKTALSCSSALLKSWNCRLGMRWNGKI